MIMALIHFLEKLPIINSLSLILLLSFLIILYKWIYSTNYNHANNKLNKPPYPPKLPILGNLHQLGKLPHHSLRSLSRQYGDLMLLHIGSKATIVASSAGTAREIMKTHDIVFANRPSLKVARKIMYDGKGIAFASYGEYWRQMKSMCVLHMLSNTKVRSFRRVREEEAQVIVKKISNMRLLQEEVNLSDVLIGLTNDVICRTAFGRKYTGEKGCENIKELLGDFSEALGTFCMEDFVPWLSWIDCLRGVNRKADKVAFVLDEFIEKIVQEHIDRQMAKFSPGTAVEVKSDENGYQGSWYAATVVGSAGVGKFLVEYQTLKTDGESDLLKEVANEQDIRPCPPEISHSNRYKEFEEVDAWYNDGWWEGVTYEVLDGWKYIVYFATTKEKLVFQHPNLRPHQNWVEGKWSLAFMKLTEEKRFNAEKPPQEIFREDMLVEVRSDEDGCQGSWYAATIIKFIAKDKFLVEYGSLKLKDESQPVTEEVSAIDVRPLPPCTMHSGRYKCLEEVDAWWAGGWWVGEVSNVLNRKK